MKKIETKHPAQLFIKCVEEGDEHYFEIQETIQDCDNLDVVGVYQLKAIKTIRKTTSTRLV